MKKQEATKKAPAKTTRKAPVKPKTPAKAKKPVDKKPAAAQKPTVKKATPKKPVAKKPKAATKKTKENEGISLKTIKNNALETVETVIDFCGVELSPRRRDFVIYYCTPGQNCYHNATQAALKAGYTPTVANGHIYVILGDPDIQKIIKENEKIAYQKFHSSAMRALDIKQARAFYDTMDFYEEKEEKRIRRGVEITKRVLKLKPMSEMTPEQRVCIDGMKMEGQPSFPVYILPDRAKELNDIIKIDSELSKSKADTSEEETREIIMERITIRETEMAGWAEDAEYEIVERPELTDDDEDEEE